MNHCICGGKSELEFDTCVDYKGRSYQSCRISCDECLRDCFVSFDSDLEDGNVIAAIVTEMWNKINIKK